MRCSRWPADVLACEVVAVVDRVRGRAIARCAAGEREGDAQRRGAEVVGAIVVLVGAPARTGGDEVKGGEAAQRLVPCRFPDECGVEATVRPPPFAVPR